LPVLPTYAAEPGLEFGTRTGVRGLCGWDEIAETDCHGSRRDAAEEFASL
jgi:hypothetical protein